MKIVSDEVRSSSKLAYFQSNSTCQLWRGKLELITCAAPLPLGLNSSLLWGFRSTSTGTSQIAWIRTEALRRSHIEVTSSKKIHRVRLKEQQVDLCSSWKVEPKKTESNSINPHRKVRRLRNLKRKFLFVQLLLALMRVKWVIGQIQTIQNLRLTRL